MTKKQMKKEYPFLRMVPRTIGMCLQSIPGDGVFNVVVGILHGISWAAIVPISAAFFDQVEGAIAGRYAAASALLWLAIYGGMLILQQLLNGVHNFHSGIVFNKIKGFLLGKVHEKASRIDPVQYESPDRLDDINKAREGAQNAPYFAFAILTSVLFYLPYILFMCIYLYNLQPILAISIPVIFLPALATLFVRSVVFAKFEDAAAPQRRRYEAMERTIADREFFKETRVLGAFRYFHRQYTEALKLLNKENWKAESRTNLCELGLKVFSLAGYGLVLFLLIRALLGGVITVGAFAAVFSSIAMLVGIIEELICGHFTSAAKQMGSVRNFLRFLDAPQRTGTVIPPSGEAGIVLKDASFRYPGAESDALRGIDLAIQPGETIAIVGGNGAGKTTLVRLMTGLFLPTEGSVQLRGVETADIDPLSLYDQTAAVFQKYQRYRMTLSQNITISDAEDGEAALAGEALHRADLDENAESFPDGMDTMLSREFDGVDLSGGQWQRVAIARGFYREHDLIVLDEPTAAIDPIEEQALYKKFAEISQDKTAIIVTHRLGSARIADRIVVMQDGGIEAIGTHQELMESGGLYAEMFASQAQWYGEEQAG